MPKSRKLPNLRHARPIDTMASSPDECQSSVASVEARSSRHETLFQGRKIVWRVWGEGHPVILLHGGFGSWTHFLRLIPYLAAERMVLCPDLPGYGDSDMPVSANIAQAIPDAICDGIGKLVPELAPDFDEIDVIGFSFGTSVAGLLCRRMVKADSRLKPRGLMLLAPSALGIQIASIEGTRRLAKGMSREQRESVHATNLGLVMLAPGTRPDAMTTRLQDLNVRRARVRGKKLSHSDALSTSLALHPVQRLAAIWGGDDPYLVGLHDRYRQALTLDYPDTSILIEEGCGHWVQHEAPQAVARFTRDFLNAMPTRSSDLARANHQRLEPPYDRH